MLADLIYLQERINQRDLSCGYYCLVANSREPKESSHDLRC